MLERVQRIKSKFPVHAHVKSNHVILDLNVFSYPISVCKNLVSPGLTERWQKSGNQVVQDKGQWESQILGRLIRSPGVPRERGIWNSQGGGKENFFFFFCLHSLVLVNYTTQFKLCTKDYTTTTYPVWGQFILPENLLADPVILKCKLWKWV